MSILSKSFPPNNFRVHLSENLTLCRLVEGRCVNSLAAPGPCAQQISNDSIDMKNQTIQKFQSRRHRKTSRSDPLQLTEFTSITINPINQLTHPPQSSLVKPGKAKKNSAVQITPPFPFVAMKIRSICSQPPPLLPCNLANFSSAPLIIILILILISVSDLVPLQLCNLRNLFPVSTVCLTVHCRLIKSGQNLNPG